MAEDTYTKECLRMERRGNEGIHEKKNNVNASIIDAGM